MKKYFKILGIGFGLFLLTIFIYERYFLTKWYDFKMGSIEIEVMSDECETCFLDWPIDHVIWIESENGNNGKFQLYTEGPLLEFGFNENNSELVINCPGFSNLFIDLEKMQEIDVTYSNRDLKLNEFKIQWIVKKNKQLIKLDSLMLPDKKWN
tara:strand:- start:90 stop:548 length:459 start_codon:yes stop_codon:yes gene_type:complete